MANLSLQRVMRHIRQLAGRRAFGCHPWLRRVIRNSSRASPTSIFGTLVCRHGLMVRTLATWRRFVAWASQTGLV
jgi:hypothetical protein